MGKYPDHFVGRQSLAFASHCLRRLKRGGEVLTYMTQVAATYPGKEISGLAHSIATGCLISLKRYKQAASTALRVLEGFPETELAKYALFDLGSLYWYWLGDRQKGEAYYRQLIAQYPDDDLSTAALVALGEWRPQPRPKPLAKRTEIPQSFRLFQNYPNPFNTSTTIRYALPGAGRVTIKVYNLLGQEVKTLVDEPKEAGYFTLQWDGKNNQGRDVASGVYICRMVAGGFPESRKLVLMR